MDIETFILDNGAVLDSTAEGSPIDMKADLFGDDKLKAWRGRAVESNLHNSLSQTQLQRHIIANRLRSPGIQKKQSRLCSLPRRPSDYLDWKRPNQDDTSANRQPEPEAGHLEFPNHQET